MREEEGEVCGQCVELAERERRARAVFDHSAATDYRVLLARHRAATHGTPLRRQNGERAASGRVASGDEEAEAEFGGFEGGDLGVAGGPAAGGEVVAEGAHGT